MSGFRLVVVAFAGLLLSGAALLACSGDPSPPLEASAARTVSLRLSSSADDAEERASGSVNLTSGDLELGTNRGEAQTVGLRFSGLSIPPNATITSAYVQFEAKAASTGSAALRIALEAADDAPAFTSKRRNLSGRPLGSASVTWAPPSWSKGAAGAAQRTPNLAPLLQELVRRPGWQAGNAVAFLITGSGQRAAVAADGDAARAAVLQVTYEAADPTPPPPSSSDVALPARAAFYYPWYPETWTVGGSHVRYSPALGYYSSGDAAVVDAHLRALKHAKVEVAIASWWGQGKQREQERLPLLLERTRASGTDLKWAIYYEKEGFGNPSAQELTQDLAYLRANYVGEQYAHVGGKPVIFVYNADDASCAVVDRWVNAAQGQWHLVLKVFSSYRTCAAQPDGWHQYAPAVASDHQAGHSYAISPGFWRADEHSPRLARDLERWRTQVRDMVASGAPWQLITTFNEWGEGTATEAASEWGTAYLDVLAADGAGATPPPAAATARLAAAGDFGGRDDRAGVAMRDLLTRDADAFFLLGDLSYDEITPEAAWCDWVKGYLGPDYPFQVLAGNHEEDSRVDGHIRDFADCLPDRLNSALGPGGYGVNYAFDLGSLTVVAISPDLTVDGVLYRYGSGSPERAWLLEEIRAARAEGDWVVVGMHKNCATMGQKSCEIGSALAQLLIDEKVDLVLQGHDHTYQRTHALRKMVADQVPADAVADSGADGQHARGAGTVFVIVGTIGKSLYACSHSDAEAGYFAAHYCSEESSSMKGYVLLDASPDALELRFIATQGSFSDRLSIR